MQKHVLGVLIGSINIILTSKVLYFLLHVIINSTDNMNLNLLCIDRGYFDMWMAIVFTRRSQGGVGSLVMIN